MSHCTGQSVNQNSETSVNAARSQASVRPRIRAAQYSQYSYRFAISVLRSFIAYLGASEPPTISLIKFRAFRSFNLLNHYNVSRSPLRVSVILPRSFYGARDQTEWYFQSKGPSLGQVTVDRMNEPGTAAYSNVTAAIPSLGYPVGWAAGAAGTLISEVPPNPTVVHWVTKIRKRWPLNPRPGLSHARGTWEADSRLLSAYY